DDKTVVAVLRAAGILDSPAEPPPVEFERPDGTSGTVRRQGLIVEEERLQPDVPVVVQVSRWDSLKDPAGVIAGFAEHVPADAGPSVEAVTDDPEGALVLQQAIATRARLAPEARKRIHLASLPMADPDENAIVVNALQRHARVVVQKSLAEGFGLTVSEAMWKARPVVGSRVGGIADQIAEGCGRLVPPRDPAAFEAPIRGYLDNPAAARAPGAAPPPRLP